MGNSYNLDNPDEIQNDIGEMLSNYDKQSKGPAKLKVVAKGLANYLKKILTSSEKNNRSKVEMVNNSYKMKMQEMETKISLDKQELERLQDAEKTAKVKVIC